MNKPTLASWLLLAGLALAGPRSARAQADDQVYTYVEQMPRLPGQTGTGAVQAAILRNYRYPADVTAGTLYLRFVVLSSGRVDKAEVLRGLSSSMDAAALDAVKRLPTFEPGKQNGRAVNVSLTIALKLAPAGSATPAPGPAPAATHPEAEAVADSLNRVYTYVEQMPQLPGGGGTPAIVSALQQLLVLPADAAEGKVFVKFTVGPHGTVYQESIVKGLTTAIDAAALAAVRRLPRFVPGKQNGRAVAVSFTIPVTVLRADHAYEAREVASRARFADPAGFYDYLRRHLKVPAVVATEKLSGLVGVDMVVQANGSIDQPTLTSHLCGSCDAEVLRVLKAMPAWTPARSYAGQPVPQRLHLDILLPLPDPAAPTAPIDQPLTYATQPPTLYDGTPLADLGAQVAQRIRYPEVVRREKITGTTTVVFVVDATGLVRNPRVGQSLCASCDQAVLDALRALGPLVPARNRSQPVAFQASILVPFNQAVK